MKILFITLLALFSFSLQFELHRLFTDNMVLQRDTEIEIYGKSNGNSVKVNLGTQEFTGQVQNGQFSVIMSKHSVGGPHRIIVTELPSGSQKVLNNVMFGDVYLCSGQSNMWWPISMSSNPEIETRESINYPNVRMFTVMLNAQQQEQTDIKESTNWQMPSIGASPQFSAVCWTFGQILNRKLGIPIGLIHSSVGGSAIEWWMSKEALALCPGSDAKSEKNYNSAFWNGMIYPLLKYKLIGGLWYQGETNAGRPVQYYCQFRAMITDWRLKFKNTMYMISTQLAGFESLDFTNIRATQFMLNYHAPNHSMATAIDLGHPTDIHPKNKRELGERMALIAESKIYKQNVVFSGPVFSKVTIQRQDTETVLKCDFSFAEGGLGLKPTDNCTTCCNDRNNIFNIVTFEGKNYNPQFEIQNDHVILRAPITKDEKIVQVRHGWTKFPQCVLFNPRTKLPVSGSFTPIE